MTVLLREIVDSNDTRAALRVMERGRGMGYCYDDLMDKLTRIAKREGFVFDGKEWDQMVREGEDGKHI